MSRPLYAPLSGPVYTRGSYRNVGEAEMKIREIWKNRGEEQEIHFVGMEGQGPLPEL